MSILNQTATLYNYIGEIDDVASYKKTILHNVKLQINKASANSSTGSKPSSKGTLFYFLSKSSADSKLVDEETFSDTEDKDDIFTFSGSGNDYIIEGTSEADSPKNISKAFRISSCNFLSTGTKSIHHWEVDLN